MNANRAALTALFALALAVFVSLGLWQLRRADERAAIVAQFAGEADRPALTVPVEHGSVEVHRFRRLQLRGRYLSSRQLLLDSMTHAGRAGYHVLTPFVPLDGSRWLLVNRGWVEADADRRVLPDIGVGEGTRQVRGAIDTLPRPGLTLGGPGGSDGWPQVVLFPTFDELEARLGAPLFHYQLLLEPGVPDGFVRDWRPRVAPPGRHIGYAIQWFSFAAVVAVMGGVLSVRARRGAVRQRDIGRRARNVIDEATEKSHHDGLE